MLVVLDAAGSSYLVVDGADLGLADPPLWVLTEGGSVRKRWSTVSEWFGNVADGVLERKARLLSRRARGKSDPAREECFDWP